MPKGLPWLALAALSLAGCAVPAVRATPARLRVVAQPVNATIYVDDRFAGSARVLDARPLPLPPGKHQITIRASGYFPHDIELALPAGTTTVKIKLRPIPP